MRSVRTIAPILCGALLSSCAHTSSFVPSPAAPAAFPEAAYTLIYSFAGGDDGAQPYASVVNANGKLYGTTYGGGGGYEWGTVYTTTTAGVERVIYRFKAGNDGAHPYGELIDVNGTLYGTTYQGGTSGNGTVFKVTTSGTEKVLYSFKGGSNDGQYPYGPLLYLNGELYGTTYQGGVYPGWGVVFKVSTSGEEHVVYKFKAGDDGAHPCAGLIDVNGSLYGTTYQGGTSGSGTVFKVSTTGSEHVVYSFKGGKDGQYPYARLTQYNGALFGTTYQGGISPGWGVVFRVSLAGKEAVLYRFKAGKDGAHPWYSPVVPLNGALYGTTYQGGASGAGTVYSVTTAGVEHVVYSFMGGTDGQYPYAGLLDVGGTLYGTTYQGGASGAGSVFKIAP